MTEVIRVGLYTNESTHWEGKFVRKAGSSSGWRSPRLLCGTRIRLQCVCFVREYFFFSQRYPAVEQIFTRYFLPTFFVTISDI